MCMTLLVMMGMALVVEPPPSTVSAAVDGASRPASGTSRDGSSAEKPTAPPAEPSGSLPEELRGMQELYGDEARLLEAVRAFDLEQQALAEWDTQMAEELAKAGQPDLAQTKRAQANRRWQLVKMAYQEVLSRYPKNARALTYYGELLYDRLGEPQKGLQSWKLAAALDPKLSAPRNDLAIYYCHVGAYEQGLRYLDEALKLEPDNPDYMYNAAQIYLIHGPQVGKHYGWDQPRIYREAMKLSKRAAELAPDDFDLVQDYAVNFFAAENFGVAANWSEAVKAWQRARAQARTKDEVFYTWLNEARVRLRQGELARAAECLDEALKLRPDSAVAKRLREKVAANAPQGNPPSPKPERGGEPPSAPEPPSEKPAHSPKAAATPPPPSPTPTPRPMNRGRIFHKE